MNRRLQINIKVLQKDINIVSARLESCTDAVTAVSFKILLTLAGLGLEPELLLSTKNWY